MESRATPDYVGRMEFALRHGMCLLDDEDWPTASRLVWHSRLSTVRGTGGRPARTAYALGHPIGSTVETEMHRLVLGLPPYGDKPVDVDHVNGNGLDNRRKNLRIATRAQNLANSGSRGGTSDFKGVSFDPRTRRWKAQITVEGQNRNLGRHATEAQAALAYNEAAREAWGEHAQLNEVLPDVKLRVGTLGSSRFRGVSWDSSRKLWIAQIAPQGKRRHLGRFATEEEAALAYNAAALEAFGKRARLNII